MASSKLSFQPREKDAVPISVLGEGTFGKIFLCHDRDGHYARKIFKNSNSFLRELAILKSSNSIFIVKLLGYSDEHEKLMFVDMEYAETGDLFSRIYNARHIYNEKQALSWLIDILLGAEYLQVRWKVSHNDLKPKNILLFTTNTGIHAKLGDLGSAFNPLGRKINDPINTGPQTVGYGPPELYEKGVIDFSADTWSSGVIAYELVAAHNPFHRDTSGLSLKMRELKIVENVKGMNFDSNLRGGRFTPTSDYKDFVYKRLLEKNPKIRGAASAVLMLPFIQENMEHGRQNSILENDLAWYKTKIAKINGRMKTANSQVKDLEIQTIGQKRRVEQLEEELGAMAPRPTETKGTQAKRRYVEAESEDENESFTPGAELVGEIPATNLLLINEIFANPQAFQQKYSFLRPSHILRLASIPEFFDFFSCDLIGALDSVMESNFYAEETHISSYYNNAAVGNILEKIKAADKFGGKTSEEIFIICGLYIAWRQPVTVVKYMEKFSSRHPQLIKEWLRTIVRKSIISGESLLDHFIGTEKLKKFYEEN